MIKTCAAGGVVSPTDDVDVPQLTHAEALQVMHDRGTYLVPTLSVRAGLAESKFPPLVQAKVDVYRQIPGRHGAAGA